MVSVGLYLPKVLLPSSLRLSPLRIKSGVDLGEGFLPPRKLLLSREEQLLHFLDGHYRRHYRGMARRRGLP
jgi:hypothetical protein